MDHQQILAWLIRSFEIGLIRLIKSTLVPTPHSFSLKVTGESGGAKESGPLGHLELLTLRGKGPRREGLLLRTGLPARPMSGPKERGPDGDQIRYRLKCEYCQLYLTMS